MLKPLIAFILTVMLAVTASAQTGGLVYYLTNSGKLVSSKEKSDYSMVVLPPDTSVDKTMYIVYEYDKNGKVRLVTNSKTNDVNLKYQGSFVSYYPDGKKQSIGRFENGNAAGRLVEYYHNGKLYNSVNYHPDGAVLYGNCRDSTGKVLAENGTGDWIQFDDSFRAVIAEGKIDSGLRVGEWREKLSDSMILVKNYKMGALISTKTVGKDGKSIFVPVDKVPEFPGGMEAFGRFLDRNVHYTSEAREKEIKGSVRVSFVVERDGSLTEIKIASGLGYGLDEEAIRVIKRMPKWIPGMQNGKAVRVAYTVPIRFSPTN